MSNNLDFLKKNVDNSEGEYEAPSFSPEVTEAKRKIEDIFNSLSIKTDRFHPEDTLKLIEEYLKIWSRIFYSEITQKIFYLRNADRDLGDFNHNLLRLVEYVRDDERKEEKKIEDDVRKAVYRLWDHVQLAINQIESLKDNVARNAAGTKDKLHQGLSEEFRKENKEVTKNYITILGIFSSIVLAFVAQLVFSTSVLENMGNKEVSIYRLVMVILLLGFFFVNVINLLLTYIFKLNERQDIIFSIRGFNDIVLFLILVDVVCWYFQLHRYHF